MSYVVICGNCVGVYGPFDSHTKAKQWLSLHANGWEMEGDCMNSHDITSLRTPPKLTPRPTDYEDESQ